MAAEVGGVGLACCMRSDALREGRSVAAESSGCAHCFDPFG